MLRSDRTARQFLSLLTGVILFGSAGFVFGTDSSTADTTPRLISTERPVVYAITIEGAIGAVTDTRIEEALTQAEENAAQLLLIRLDTPGGFSNATSTICKRFLNSEVPVCIYIAPQGARAGSAGVYMTYAAHFAAMAPSTNIGAAHPVSGDGKEIDSIMNEKVTNDAVAQIKAAAEKRGRNIEWAEAAVRQSVSITYSEALAKGVIDVVANDEADLFRQLHGRTTETPLGKRQMHLLDPRIEEINLSFVHKLLQILTSPDVVFILFSIGGLGIVLELYNPGSILPGVVGAISLILAFYAFQTLPINYAGVALIILAIVLFIAEVKIVSHGLLTVGGIVALFLGGLMLIDTVDPTLRVSLDLLITVSLLVGGTAAVVLFFVVRAQRSRPFLGNSAMVGKLAEVRNNDYVYVDGALWKYRCSEPLDAGTRVTVTAVTDLTLDVQPTRSTPGQGA